MQVITTTAVDVNEIQVIATSATPVNEVHSITISPPPGEISINNDWYFSIEFDTTPLGGSLQYSGQISATADASGSRNSLSEILGNMLNIDLPPIVSKSLENPDGGHTYSVTFPLSMKDPPQMKVFMSDLPVVITIIEKGNVLGGTFRLEYEGDITENINFDADASEVQVKFEALTTVGSVNVFRGAADDQNGFSWEIEFISNLNSGNLDDIVPYGDGLTTSNLENGAKVQVVGGGTDGSYIGGSFQVQFGKILERYCIICESSTLHVFQPRAILKPFFVDGETSSAISCDADAASFKSALSDLTAIRHIAVSRSPGDNVGGYSWTVSFLDDVSHYHQGDLPGLTTISNLVGGSGYEPQITVTELRKGTVKEVQVISVTAGGGIVDTSSSFCLKFGGQITNDILAIPADGLSCSGTRAAQQVITTSTEDTTGGGGDNAISPLTNLALLYGGSSTNSFSANEGSCETTASIIEVELERLPNFHDVTVTGTDSGMGLGGCIWVVTFNSFIGNPAMLEGESVGFVSRQSYVSPLSILLMPVYVEHFPHTF